MKTGVHTGLRRLFARNRVNERNGDLASVWIGNVRCLLTSPSPGRVVEEINTAVNVVADADVGALEVRKPEPCCLKRFSTTSRRH